MKPYIIIYDSDCAFCTWCVLFVLRHKSRDRFLFAGLSSKTALEFFQSKNITDAEMIWLIEPNGQYHYRSSATIRVTGLLSTWYAPVYALLLVPKPIRDWCYNWVAKRRKRFVKNNVCPIIPSEYSHLFVS